MPLADRSDFQAWLKRFNAQHEALRGDSLDPPADTCDGCGLPIAEPISSSGLCLVCLAEIFGRDQSRTAARVAGALEAALARDAGETPINDVREAVEEILDRYERDVEPEDL